MGPDRFAVCMIVQAEVEIGAYKSVKVEANLRNVRRFLAPLVNLPFASQAATAYGQIRAALEQQGTPDGGNDIMIAAVARGNDLVILTDNLRGYARIPALLYDQWLRRFRVGWCVFVMATACGASLLRSKPARWGPDRLESLAYAPDAGVV